MAKQDDGGRAFARATAFGGNNGAEWGDEGMSLLDYFAAHALVGNIAQAWHPDMGYGPPNEPIESRAAWCYDMASAMVAEKRRRES